MKNAVPKDVEHDIQAECQHCVKKGSIYSKQFQVTNSKYKQQSSTYFELVFVPCMYSSAFPSSFL